MNKILVIADASIEKNIAISEGDKLAKAYDATMHIVYFFHEDLRGLGQKGEAFKKSILSRLEEKANDQLAQYADNNRYTYEVVWEKHVDQWTIDYCQSHDPIMVLKTGHRSERLFYTPTDWQLIRYCPAPVFLLSEEKWKRADDILAAVDLSTKIEDKQALNHTILAKAKELATKLDVNVQVCYTPLFSTFLRDLGLQYKDEIEVETEKTMAPLIAELSAKYQIPVENFHIKAGKPEQVIPSTAAKLRTGIVVVGSVGRKEKLLGSTAEKILGLLKTDVMVLKP